MIKALDYRVKYELRVSFYAEEPEISAPKILVMQSKTMNINSTLLNKCMKEK